MTIDKEYPATHSMDTAWYVADEDGNVAIVNYNENGPVPCGTEETVIDSIVLGSCDEEPTRPSVSLTDDQIDELMENRHSPEAEKDWSYNCIVQIDTAKESEFLELSKNEGFKIEKCLSKERGLYMIDALGCLQDKDFVHKLLVRLHLSKDAPNALQEMLKRNIIVWVYSLKDMFVESVWDDDKETFEKHFDNLPYFVFSQHFDSNVLSERLNIPKNPVKLSQLPESLRRVTPVLPIKFSEKDKFQIAEWTLCNFADAEIEEIDGCEYALTSLTDGSKAYVLTNLCAKNFINYCPEKENFKCDECRGFCYTGASFQRIGNPTVVQIISPLGIIDNTIREDIGEIALHSIWFPFLPKVPYRKMEEGTFFPEDVERKVSRKQLEEYYLKSYRYLEDKIDCFKPRVLILDELSEEVMSKKYGISNGRMTICGVEYPVFKRSEMESRRAEIEALALLPYRGKKIPHIITVEEMKKLKGE